MNQALYVKTGSGLIVPRERIGPAPEPRPLSRKGRRQLERKGIKNCCGGCGVTISWTATQCKACADGAVTLRARAEAAGLVLPARD